MPSYDHLSKEELVRLLQARDRRDATRFGLVWEANEIERDAAINADFVAQSHHQGVQLWLEADASHAIARTHHRISESSAMNEKDFQGFVFDRVWNRI